MIIPSDIMSAINIILVAENPVYTVYLQKCPIDFQRPSFLLEYVKTSRRDTSRWTVEKTVYFKISCFVNTEENFTSGEDSLSNIQESVVQLFSGGYVNVGDRAIKVQSSTGGFDADRAYVDLQFEFFDDRTDAVETNPLMASVKTNLYGG